MPTVFTPTEDTTAALILPKQRIKEELGVPAPPPFVLQSPPEAPFYLEDFYYGVTTDNEVNQSGLTVAEFVAQVSTDLVWTKCSWIIVDSCLICW